MKKISVVTGANRGIGFEVARQLGKSGQTVVLTSRDEVKGRQAADKLRAEGLDVQFHQLDVSNQSSIDHFTKFVEKEFGRIDVLVNNAGILKSDNTFSAKRDDLISHFETNTLGAFFLCQKLIPMMRKAGHGRIVNVSTGMAQLSDMDSGYPSYRLSKTALNAVTRIFSQETEGTDILVNSVCPGWVKTDMGGPNADRSVEKGAETIVWLSTLPKGGPTGGFFRDKKQIDW